MNTQVLTGRYYSYYIPVNHLVRINGKSYYSWSWRVALTEDTPTTVRLP